MRDPRPGSSDDERDVPRSPAAACDRRRGSEKSRMTPTGRRRKIPSIQSGASDQVVTALGQDDARVRCRCATRPRRE